MGIIANVGDSGLVLGIKNTLVPAEWKAKQLTKDHRPDNKEELARNCVLWHNINHNKKNIAYSRSITSNQFFGSCAACAETLAR